MNASRYLRTTLAALSLITLSSCSLAYDVEITADAGKLVFTPYELGFFGGRKRAVVRVQSIAVEAIGRRPSTVWKFESPEPHGNGTDLPSFVYGVTPDGFIQKTAAQPLATGQLYYVNVDALGGGGDRYFVISSYSHYREPDVTVLTETPKD